jgi:hypothetical protein
MATPTGGAPFEPTLTKETTAAAEEAKGYQPTSKERTLLKLIEDAYVRGRQIRRPHEGQWFVNKAFDRGQQYVVWSESASGLQTPPAPKHRIRLVVNLIQPTLRARASKFLKNRPVPKVVPATSDVRDRQNARFTQKAMEYQTRRLRLEAKYALAVQTTQLMGHAYWWVYWDPTVRGRIRTKDELTGEVELTEAAIGDVGLECDQAWSVLVGDPTQPFIGDQPWLVRIKVRSLDYLKGRFPEKGKFVKGESTQDDALRHEWQTATLNSQGVGGAGLPEGPQGRGESVDGLKTHAIVKEFFERPCPDYPKGRYLVAAGGVLLREQEFLPYGFEDLPNPYPVIDFMDVGNVGQYWGTTICEQLITPQREYNLLRSKVAEHLRMMALPKLLIAKQHQLPKGSWTSEAGEIIEYLALPNIGPPVPWHPPNIASDVWRMMEVLRREMQDIAHIYPESEGQRGGSESGFQTNLLQEAADAVHQPDIDAHGRCLEEAMYKIRRLMKQGYEVERLITVSGRDLEPEAFEFSSEQIDDYADIVMLASSALPTLPSAKSSMILDLWKAGIYGPVDDPEARRKVAVQLEMGTVEDTFYDARKDEQQARVENDAFLDGQAPPVPEFYENHALHYRIHTDLLKSPRSVEQVQREVMIAHIIGHVKFQNPQSAVQLALQYGMPELVQELMPPPGAAPGGGPAPSGAPPSAPPGMPPMAAAGPAGSPAPASMGPMSMPAPMPGPMPPGPTGAM